jgi:hypothetical protein
MDTDVLLRERRGTVMSHHRTKFFAVCAVALAAACTGPDDLLLDVGNEDHPRYAELRARLAVTLAS